MSTILNIAAGKMFPVDYTENDKSFFLVNADTMYYDATDPEVIEAEYDYWKKAGADSSIFYCKHNVFEFMERTKIIFDRVTVYRFLEHVPFTNVEYFIYLLSTITQPGAIIDIIVPDYDVLAKMILKEKIDKNFPANNILITTEVLNQPPDSHASVWTEKRAKYFFELEKRFKVTEIYKNYEFDGRNIYLRFFAERI